jgi:hypothetical protein
VKCCVVTDSDDERDELRFGLASGHREREITPVFKPSNNAPAFDSSSIDWDACEAQGKSLSVVFTTNGQSAGATGSPIDVVLEYDLRKHRNSVK